MHANVVMKFLLGLGAADLCALNLLLVPHLGDTGNQSIPALAQEAPTRRDPAPRTEDRAEVVAVSSTTAVPDAAPPAARDVHFAFGSAKIRQRAAVDDLEEVRRELAEDPARTVLIRGHSDPLGTPAQNLDLSWRRAAAVRQYLIWRGAPPDRIAIEALGDTEPVAGTGPAAWANDRRVEIVWR